MSRLVDIIRSIFISPEIIWILIVTASYFWLPDFLSQIGNRLLGNSGALEYLWSLPFIFTAATFTISGKLRSSVDVKHDKQLYEWPGYIRIVDRIYVGFAFCIISSIVAGTAWLFTDVLAARAVASALLSSIGVAGIAAFTIYLASHRLKEILVKNVQ